MNYLLLVTILASAITNLYLMNKPRTIIEVTVPVPDVHVTVEAPEPVELQAIETVTCDHSVLEEILRQLADIQTRQQPLPYVIPNPTPVPQYPTHYPVISEGGISTTRNDIEIDGVKGKKFPAR